MEWNNMILKDLKLAVGLHLGAGSKIRKKETVATWRLHVRGTEG